MQLQNSFVDEKCENKNTKIPSNVRIDILAESMSIILWSLLYIWIEKKIISFDFGRPTITSSKTFKNELKNISHLCSNQSISKSVGVNEFIRV